MIDLAFELRSIDEVLLDATRFTGDLAYRSTIASLIANISEVEYAWYGSWIGYLANVYYRDFDSPPLDTYRLLEMEREAKPNGESRNDSGWCRYTDSQVDSAIEEGIERSDITKAFDHTLQWADIFEEKKMDVVAIIKIAQARHNSIFDPLAAMVERLHIRTPEETVESMVPVVLETEYPVARQQAIRIPPHIRYDANIKWSRRSASTVRMLRKVIRRTLAQIERTQPTKAIPHLTGNKIFIGHGRDKSWLELQKFIEKELKLPVTAYEEVPASGLQVYDHVMSRVREAAIAFLVMTGEDTVIDKDGNERVHPRLNVVHELGICQSMLGMGRAIALLEEGCEVPSKIAGFDQVRFEEGNILSASRGIRRVLEREEIM